MRDVLGWDTIRAIALFQYTGIRKDQLIAIQRYDLLRPIIVKEGRVMVDLGVRVQAHYPFTFVSTYGNYVLIVLH